jgi:hypothetical protein
LCELGAEIENDDGLMGHRVGADRRQRIADS